VLARFERVEDLAVVNLAADVAPMPPLAAVGQA
jgi:hypothetical protein